MPCWKGISTSSSATPGISGTCRVARPMWKGCTEWIADLVRHGLIAKSFVPRRRKLQRGSCASCCAIAASWWRARRPSANRLLKFSWRRPQHQAGQASPATSSRVSQARHVEGSDRGQRLGRGRWRTLPGEGNCAVSGTIWVLALEGRMEGAPSLPACDTATAPSRSGRAGYRRPRRPHREAKARILPRPARPADADSWGRLGESPPS